LSKSMKRSTRRARRFVFALSFSAGLAGRAGPKSRRFTIVRHYLTTGSKGRSSEAGAAGDADGRARVGSLNRTHNLAGFFSHTAALEMVPRTATLSPGWIVFARRAKLSSPER